MRQFKKSLTALEIYLQFQEDKDRCDRKEVQLIALEKDCIKKKVPDSWTPDVIIGQNEKPISYNMRTLFRQFKSGEFDQSTLPIN